MYHRFDENKYPSTNIRMNEFNLTHSEIRILNDDIRQSSTTQLRKILKEDIPVELDDMINYELYIREFS